MIAHLETELTAALSEVLFDTELSGKPLYSDDYKAGFADAMRLALKELKTTTCNKLCPYAFEAEE
ncbi:MAG: hypothetical protein Ta2A_05920 [Treponemataceae bacterium]|nr:MAG: hypothetical protein Ta2A_05920 [Treponemataceae bacterium]